VTIWLALAAIGTLLPAQQPVPHMPEFVAPAPYATPYCPPDPFAQPGGIDWQKVCQGAPKR
jgi:hypothetical protein